MSIEAMKQALEVTLLGIVQEAFIDGFTSPTTYNDAVLNDSSEEWVKQREAYLGKLRAAIQQVECEPVILWQYRWLNPGNKADASPQELAWKNVDHAWPHLDIASQVESLKGYRFGGKPNYEVRALYTHPAPGVPVVCKGCGASSEKERCIGCQHDFGTTNSVVLDALQTGKHYAEEVLSIHDQHYQRHPSAESERNSILTDIELIDAAMLTASPAQKG